MFSFDFLEQICPQKEAFQSNIEKINFTIASIILELV